MEDYSEEQITKALESIKTMDHYTMCKYWRFAPEGTEIYFRSDISTGKEFKDRLFKHFGGFTPAISKQLGH
jgi:hypothetical protein